METATVGQGLPRPLSPQRETAAVVGLFAATLFLSALLLFSVQPMFAKIVLPRLGGSPSVWAVSMCFFQAVLLAGYCYAHALNRFLSPRIAPLAHLVLLAVALLALPIGLPASVSEPPAGDVYLWLIGTLGLGVGLPFFAVSANAPLLQSWFACTQSRHAKDPYFLYGASNLGSLVALLAYPFVIEPFVGVASQTKVWTTGFFLLALAIAACGFLLRESVPANAIDDLTEKPATRAVARPAWSQRLSWIGLAAVPSGLLVAYTNYLSTDIASAPFLWVLPLAMFLATFILTFTERPPLSHEILQRLQPLCLAATIFGLAMPGGSGWFITVPASTAAFFVTTMIAHRELYQRRPAATNLTEFYLWMSLGGVIGGVFAAIVAPQVFNAIWEFPLLLLLGLACRPGLIQNTKAGTDLRSVARITCIAMVGMVVIGIAMRQGLLGHSNLAMVFFINGFALLAILSHAKPFAQLAYGFVITATLAVLPTSMNRGDAERSFFGVHYVTTTPDKQLRSLMHGTTLHGAERLATEDGKPVARPMPSTYYYPSGPMARGVQAARVASGKLEANLNVGIVGLGAGSMACNSAAGETWRFYEIDPVVVRIARDSGQFRHLSTCQPKADIVLGDARLTLAKEKPGAFDYLVVDAFSSDSIPVHLLTKEALELYLSRLAHDGILALHISNRHLDLAPVVAAMVKTVSGARAMLANDQALHSTTFDATASLVVFVTKSDVAMQPIRVLPFVEEIPASNVAPWTDDYSNIMSAIWRKYRG